MTVPETKTGGKLPFSKPMKSTLNTLYSTAYTQDSARKTGTPPGGGHRNCEIVKMHSGRTTATLLATKQNGQAISLSVLRIGYAGLLTAARRRPAGLRRCGPGLSAPAPCGRCLQAPGLRAGR